MREFQRKRKMWRLLYSRVVLLVLLIALVFLLKQSWDAYGREREGTANLLRAQEELAALQARSSLLEAKLTRLKAPEGIEAEIREQFQVAKPGERMVVVLENKTVAEDVSEPSQSFVSRLFEFFR